MVIIAVGVMMVADGPRSMPGREGTPLRWCCWGRGRVHSEKASLPDNTRDETIRARAFSDPNSKVGLPPNL